MKINKEFRLLVRFSSCCLFSLLWQSRFATCDQFRWFRMRFSVFAYVFITLVVIFLITIAFDPQIESFHLHFYAVFGCLDIWNEMHIQNFRVDSRHLEHTNVDWPFFLSTFTERVLSVRSLIATFSSRSSVSVAWSSFNAEHFWNWNGNESSDCRVAHHYSDFLLSKIPLRHPSHTQSVEHAILLHRKAHRFLADHWRDHRSERIVHWRYSIAAKNPYNLCKSVTEGYRFRSTIGEYLTENDKWDSFIMSRLQSIQFTVASRCFWTMECRNSIVSALAVVSSVVHFAHNRHQLLQSIVDISPTDISDEINKQSLPNSIQF